MSRMLKWLFGNVEKADIEADAEIMMSASSAGPIHVTDDLYGEAICMRRRQSWSTSGHLGAVPAA